MQPAIVLNLLLELTGRPTGVTQRKHRSIGSIASRDCFENVDSGGEADTLGDRQRRIVDEKIGRVQHEAATGLDRSAFEHSYRLRAARQLNALRGGNDLE